MVVPLGYVTPRRTSQLDALLTFWDVLSRGNQETKFIRMAPQGLSRLDEQISPAHRRRHPMQEYRNDKLVVRYDPAICIHAGECVRGLPSVFNVSKKPWIDVNGASQDAIVDQVKRCPSGALTYELLKKAQ
jgi:uncharacterized Fe-S cluster protein YjdI